MNVSENGEATTWEASTAKHRETSENDDGDSGDGEDGGGRSNGFIVADRSGWHGALARMLNVANWSAVSRVPNGGGNGE